MESQIVSAAERFNMAMLLIVREAPCCTLMQTSVSKPRKKVYWGVPSYLGSVYLVNFSTIKLFQSTGFADDLFEHAGAVQTER